MRMNFGLGCLCAAVIGLAALSARAEVDKKTERTWKSKCAACHGKTGNGDTEAGKKAAVGDYTKPAWQKGITDAAIKKAILDGVNREKGGVKQEMDAFKDKGLDEAAADNLLKLIRSFK